MKNFKVWGLIFLVSGAILILVLVSFLVLKKEVKMEQNNRISQNISVKNPQKSEEKLVAKSSVVEKKDLEKEGEKSQNLLFKPELKIKLPIIMYHHVLGWDGADTEIEKSLRVSPEVFEKHLQYLKKEGYETINTYDLIKYKSGEKKLPKKPILLTFDDGYDDNFTHAFTLLKKYKMVGDFAIITEAVGREKYLTWGQIQKMDLEGMSISSHTLNHCALAKKTQNPTDLKRNSFEKLAEGVEKKPCSFLNSGEKLSASQVFYELEKSQKILQEKLKKPIKTVVYPYGGYNDEVVKIAQDLGYVLGLTVSPQKEENVDLNEPFDLPRYRAFGQNDGEVLKGFFNGLR